MSNEERNDTISEAERAGLAGRLRRRRRCLALAATPSLTPGPADYRVVLPRRDRHGFPSPRVDEAARDDSERVSRVTCIKRASAERDRQPRSSARTELARSAFLETGRPLHALLLTGGPGIGKTTLWEAGVEAGRRHAMRVLVSRRSSAEGLSFAGLIDLLDGIDVAALSGLAAPQAHALQVALLRERPDGSTAPEAAGVGFLSALRILAAREPLLVAIDDVQWLDPPSAEALAFAARRLDGSSVAFLLTRRRGRASTLEQVLDQRYLRAARGSAAQPRRDPISPVSTTRADVAAAAGAPDRRRDARQPALRTRGRTNARRARACLRSGPSCLSRTRSRSSWTRAWRGFRRPCVVCYSQSR